MEPECPSCEARKSVGGTKLSTIALLVLIGIIIVLLLWPVLVEGKAIQYSVDKLFEIIDGTVSYAWLALLWIVIGIFLGGAALEFIPRHWFTRELGGTGPFTVVKAAIAGMFIDVCSHGALAVGMGIYRAGASVAATVTFLLATPWLGLMETMLLLGLLGFKITVAMIVTSFLAAVTIGIIMGQIEKRKWIETHTGKHKLSKKKFSIWKEARKGVRQFDWNTLPKRLKRSLREGWMLFSMIGIWLVIGFIAAGVVLSFISPETIQSLMGYASATALPFTALIASLIEVCSEGTVPLAAAFKDMGASIGAVFVFLMAGVASDITELGTITDVIGKRAAIATFVVAIVVTIFFGYLLNWFWLTFIL